MHAEPRVAPHQKKSTAIISQPSQIKVHFRPLSLFVVALGQEELDTPHEKLVLVQ